MAITFSAAQQLTADDLNALVPLYVTKGSDESVTSSTTLQDDNDLFLDLPVGVWHISVYLTFSGAAAGDIRVAYSRTGTMSTPGNRDCLGPQAATTDTTATTMRTSGAHAMTTNITYGTDGSTVASAKETFIQDVSVTGRITVQWAQGTSSGTATIMRSGSYMIAHRIG